jgi:ParB-like chromosome segregation protein Spo0J
MAAAPKIALLTIPLDQLHALRRNPQYLSERQVEALKASIDRDGFIAPIVVRKRKPSGYEVLSGNHRVMAMRELGRTEIACCLIHPCDDSRAARIAVNMNTVHGDPNAELIAPFLAEAPDEALRDIYLPDDLLADVRAFDALLAERLASLEIPDALDNEKSGAIPNCVCQCGHRHAARAAETSSVSRLSVGTTAA